MLCWSLFQRGGIKYKMNSWFHQCWWITHGNSSCTIEWPSGSSGGLVEAMPVASGLGSLTRCLEMRICISFEVLGDARVQKMFIFVVIL